MCLKNTWMTEWLEHSGWRGRLVRDEVIEVSKGQILEAKQGDLDFILRFKTGSNII